MKKKIRFFVMAVIMIASVISPMISIEAAAVPATVPLQTDGVDRTVTIDGAISESEWGKPIATYTSTDCLDDKFAKDDGSRTWDFYQRVDKPEGQKVEIYSTKDSQNLYIGVKLVNASPVDNYEWEIGQIDGILNYSHLTLLVGKYDAKTTIFNAPDEGDDYEHYNGWVLGREWGMAWCNRTFSQGFDSPYRLKAPRDNATDPDFDIKYTDNSYIYEIRIPFSATEISPTDSYYVMSMELSDSYTGDADTNVAGKNNIYQLSMAATTACRVTDKSDRAIVQSNSPMVVSLCNHKYDNVCDAECNICGYIRTAPHDFENGTYESDSTQHWKKCAGCDATTARVEHYWVRTVSPTYLKQRETCHSKGVYYQSCAVCSEKNMKATFETEVDPSNHDGETEVRGKIEPTFYQDGYTGDTYCKGCGAKIATGTTDPATGDIRYYIFNGCMTIYGPGALENFVSAVAPPWAEQAADITEVHIAGNVTSIGNYAFRALTKLGKVTADNPALTFGYYVFPTSVSPVFYGVGGGTLDSFCKANGYTLMRPANPTTPGAPTIASYTDSSVTLTATAGYEYKIGGGAWQASNIFTGLALRTKTYTFYQRVAETAEYLASASSEGTSFTKPTDTTVPVAPTVSYYTDSSVTLVPTDGYEYKMGNGSWQASNIFTGLTAGSSYTFYQRVAETALYLPSASSSGETQFTLAKAGKPGLSGIAGRTVTLTAAEGYEYSLGGNEWQDSAVFENAPTDTLLSFYRRLKETQEHGASPVSDAFTVLIVAPPEIIKADLNRAVLSMHMGYEYSADGVLFQNSSILTDLPSLLDFTLFQRPKNADAYDAVSIIDNGSILVHIADLPMENKTVSYGDCNDDGAIDLKDVTRLKKYLAKINPKTGVSSQEMNVTAADCSGDGLIDLKDVTRLKKYLAKINPKTGQSSVHLGPEE